MIEPNDRRIQTHVLSENNYNIMYINFDIYDLSIINYVVVYCKHCEIQLSSYLWCQ